jgi:pectinesterase
MQKSMALEISNLGYQVFTIEYRLSDEAKYPAGINDLESALKFIIKNASKFEVNPSKIAILGCSSGAQMATLVGQKHPKKLKLS